MASEIKNLKWVNYLKCKECLEFKELSNDLWYKHNEWFMWVLWRCKECIKNWRKTDHELCMARKRDSDRYYNNPIRRKYIYVSSRIRRKEKWYTAIHLACSRAIKKLWIRPSICSICKKENKRIEAHHYNYEYPFKIIFCCKICHSKLDRWITDYNKCDIVDIEPVNYKSKIKWIDHKINTTWSCF